MKLRSALAAALVSLAVLALAGNAAARSEQIGVAVDRTSITTSIGHTFTLRATISNRGSAPVRDLVAHLNVLSFRRDVYIDPEDWSSHRTRYLAPIPAGGSVSLDLKLQAVNSGSIGVYIAVLPRSGAAEPPITGPTVHVSIARRRTLNSGGILPLALGIPAALGLLTVGSRLSRRRRRHA